ncbi:RNA polymerase subunit sigma-54 [uncultured Roseibium sp.]|uniref:RNA polymerase subunit sigma-54 n=1 Tax=uncultured Roseibium sp. TaxID=1936171 RepID=UPI002625CF38|nr:RNA polymerase subunit sigma-54 [uncultured Roseibium sp.]
MNAAGTITEMELPEISAARAILAALNHILGEHSQKTVTSQQVVNELLPGAASLRNWFLYLIDEAAVNDSDDEARIETIQKALGFQPKHFERGCNIALSIVA